MSEQEIKRLKTIESMERVSPKASAAVHQNFNIEAS